MELDERALYLLFLIHGIVYISGSYLIIRTINSLDCRIRAWEVRRVQCRPHWFRTVARRVVLTIDDHPRLLIRLVISARRRLLRRLPHIVAVLTAATITFVALTALGTGNGVGDGTDARRT